MAVDEPLLWDGRGWKRCCLKKKKKVSEIFKIPGVNLERFLTWPADKLLPRSSIRVGLPEHIDPKKNIKAAARRAGRGSPWLQELTEGGWGGGGWC